MLFILHQSRSSSPRLGQAIDPYHGVTLPFCRTDRNRDRLEKLNIQIWILHLIDFFIWLHRFRVGGGLILRHLGEERQNND